MHHDDNLLVLLATIAEVLYAFGLLLTACELCQRNSQAFNECSDMVEQIDWYSFPVEIQRIMPIIFHFTQQPIELIFFGSSVCNREAFKYVSETEQNQSQLMLVIIEISHYMFQVFNKAFSFFTILRQFYN